MASWEWNASVGCEGGPVIVAPYDTFLQWPGGRYLPLEQRTALHVWGQFTAELPEKFHPTGPVGHHFIAARGQALFDLRDELINVIERSWPDARVSINNDEGRGHILRKDYKQLWFDLAPLSEYERCWQEYEPQDAWYHRWGEHSALFWQVEGGGVVDVGVAEDRSELVLLRTWVNDQRYEEAARALVMAEGVTEEGSLPSFEAQQILVVCWAQADPAEIEGIEDIERASFKEPPSLGIPGIGGVCTALKISPGTYHVTHGTHEDEEWSSRWCRLKKTF